MFKKRRSLGLVQCFVALAGMFASVTVSCTAQTAAPTVDEQQEECAVLSAFLRAVFQRRSQPGKGSTLDPQLIIESETSVPTLPMFEPHQFLDKEIHEQPGVLNRTIIDNFFARNASPEIIQGPFAVNFAYRIISKESLKVFAPDFLGWDTFYKEFPNSHGIANFSAVGFSRNHKHAIFFASKYGGPIDAEWYFVTMQKIGGNWKIKKRTLIGIS